MEPVRRIGAVGDIHAEDRLLERALAELTDAGVDLLVAVGDIVDGPGDVDRCCRLLEAYGVPCVRGNHERWLLAGSLRSLPHATSLDALQPSSQRWLRGLPATRSFATAAGPLLLCHGLGDDDMGKVLPDEGSYWHAQNDALQALLRRREFALVINGHSHRPMDLRLDGLRILNAGTLCRDHDPGYLLVDLGRDEVSFRSLR